MKILYVLSGFLFLLYVNPAFANPAYLNVPGYNCLSQAKPFLRQAVSSNASFTSSEIGAFLRNEPQPSSANMTLEQASYRFIKGAKFMRNLPLGPTALEIATYNMLVVMAGAYRMDIAQSEEDARSLAYLGMEVSLPSSTFQAAGVFYKVADDLKAVLLRDDARCLTFNVLNATNVDKNYIRLLRDSIQGGPVMPREPSFDEHTRYRASYANFMDALVNNNAEIATHSESIPLGRQSNIAYFSSVSFALRQPRNAEAYSDVQQTLRFVNVTPCVNYRGMEVGNYYVAFTDNAGIYPESCDAVVDGKCLIAIPTPVRDNRYMYEVRIPYKTSFNVPLNASTQERFTRQKTYSDAVQVSARLYCGFGLP